MRPLTFLTLFGLLAVSCAPDQESVAAGLAPDEPHTEEAAEPTGLEPVHQDWRKERKRLAMLGLAYDTGRAVVVPNEARTVLSGLSRADVPRLIEEGELALSENRALDAIPAFTKVVLLEPEVASHYLLLGESLLAFRLESQAIVAYETGLEIDPQDAEIVFRVGDMAWRTGDSARAVALLEQVTELDPDHASAWGRLARIRFFAEEDDAAWAAVHHAQDLGEAMPPQMLALLNDRTPEPVR